MKHLKTLGLSTALLINGLNAPTAQADEEGHHQEFTSDYNSETAQKLKFFQYRVGLVIDEHLLCGHLNPIIQLPGADLDHDTCGDIHFNATYNRMQRVAFFEDDYLLIVPQNQLMLHGAFALSLLSSEFVTVRFGLGVGTEVNLDSGVISKPHIGPHGDFLGDRFQLAYGFALTREEGKQEIHEAEIDLGFELIEHRLAVYANYRRFAVHQELDDHPIMQYDHHTGLSELGITAEFALTQNNHNICFGVGGSYVFQEPGFSTLLTFGQCTDLVSNHDHLFHSEEPHAHAEEEDHEGHDHSDPDHTH